MYVAKAHDSEDVHPDYPEQHHKLAVLRFLYVFNVVPNVPLERTITYEELASACGLREDVDKLRRIVRYAIGMRLLREPFPGEVAHSAASRILATEQPARDWLGRNVMEALPSAVCLTDALSKWPGNTSKDKTAANIAFGYQGSWFEWLRTQPERAARFGGGMGFMSSDAKDTAVTDVTQGFAWEELPARSKFVDVGGGNGQIAIEILRRAGQLRGVVQDQQSVISQIGGPPNDLGDRLKFEVADFFAPQEEKDAEVYLFRRVFHDWPDTDCLRVLHATIPSMKTGATLLVNDFVLPRPGTVGDWDEQWLRGVDLQMMITFNSRERTLDDWVKLVEGGSKGRLKLQRSSKSILSFVKID